MAGRLPRVVATHWVHPEVTDYLKEFSAPVVPPEEPGVWLTIVPDSIIPPTAELAVGLAVGIMRRVGEADRAIRAAGTAGAAVATDVAIATASGAVTRTIAVVRSVLRIPMSGSLSDPRVQRDDYPRSDRVGRSGAFCSLSVT